MSAVIDLATLDVCFLAGTLAQGGAERQLYYILRALKGHGARVRLLTLTRGEFWEAPIRDLGVPIEWVGQQSARIARLKRIVSTLRCDPPDLIQSQHFYTNLYAVAAARFLGVREVGAIRCDVKCEIGARGYVFGRLSLRAPRFLAANSHGAIAYAIRCGLAPNRVQFLPNVVEVSDLEALGATRGPPLRIVNIGRLHQQKRVDIFLDVIAALHEIAPGKFKATIAGDGPERARLEQQAQNLGLSPHVVNFSGHVTDTREIYRRADLLILTSDWEGTPNVILEAMSWRVPVIGTAVGGVPEVISDGETGFLAAAGDTNQLLKRASELLNDAGLRARIAEAAWERIAARHAPAVLPGRLREIYEAALA